MLVRKEELVWGLLSPYAFQTMYVYSDLEPQVVGDTQANLFHILVPRGEPGDVVAEEIKLPTYHRLRTSVFSSVKLNIRGDTGEPIPFASGTVRMTFPFLTQSFFLNDDTSNESLLSPLPKSCCTLDATWKRQYGHFRRVLAL